MGSAGVGRCRCMVQMYGTEIGYRGMEVRRYGTEVWRYVLGGRWKDGYQICKLPYRSLYLVYYLDEL